MLVNVARQQQDTARWLRRSQELVEVCHGQGEDAEPEALRTEAEVGAVLNQLLATNADGQSFPNYINDIRLSEACRLLRDEPAKTVVAIADEVGLSPRYLRRLFFEQYGVTPTEYRAGLPGD